MSMKTLRSATLSLSLVSPFMLAASVLVATPVVIMSATTASACDVQIGRRGSCDAGYRGDWANGNHGPRGTSWDPGGGVRRGGYQQPQQRMVRRPVHGGQRYGGGQQQRGPFMVRRSVIHHGGERGNQGGRVIVTGQHRDVELRRGENYAVAQSVPLTPGPTRPAMKSPYENLGTKDGVTYFAVDAD